MRPFLALLFLTFFVLRIESAEARKGPVFDRLRALQQAQTAPVTEWRFH